MSVSDSILWPEHIKFSVTNVSVVSSLRGIEMPSSNMWQETTYFSLEESILKKSPSRNCFQFGNADCNIIF